MKYTPYTYCIWTFVESDEFFHSKRNQFCVSLLSTFFENALIFCRLKQGDRIYRNSRIDRQICNRR